MVSLSQRSGGHPLAGWRQSCRWLSHIWTHLHVTHYLGNLTVGRR